MPPPASEVIVSRAAQPAGPRLHRGQAQVARAQLGVAGVEAATVVDDLEDEPAVVGREPDGEALGRRVAQRRCGAPPGRCAGRRGRGRGRAARRRRRRSRRRRRRRGRGRARRPACAAPRPARRARGRAAAARGRACAARRAPRAPAPAAARAARAPAAGSSRSSSVPADSAAEHEREELLADDVVELEREPVALGEDRQLARCARPGARWRWRSPRARRAAR